MPESQEACSRDGRRFAYMAAEHGVFVDPRRSCVLVDGTAGPAFDQIWDHTVIFSPDGKPRAYIAKKGEKWFAVVDGQLGTQGTTKLQHPSL